MKKRSFALAASLAVLLAACGQQQSAAPVQTATAAPAAAAPAAAPTNTAGASVYNKTCAMCHTPGVAGAPKPGDKADWEPRIAQGNDVLYKHAIDGFTGSKGMMPPRGGGSSLSDEDVKAAVDFMVEKSR